MGSRGRENKGRGRASSLLLTRQCDGVETTRRKGLATYQIARIDVEAVATHGGRPGKSDDRNNAQTLVD
jgi:hypothetical protein